MLLGSEVGKGGGIVVRVGSEVEVGKWSGVDRT